MGDVVKDELKKAAAPAFTFDIDMLTYGDFKQILAGTSLYLLKRVRSAD